MAKFFIFPFASTGDKTAVPDDTQVSGSVSYEEGFGQDYQRDLATDPLAKAIPRDQTNQLYYDITDNIQQYQTHGVPNFIETADNDGVPYEYDLYARVRYDDGGGFKIYESQVNANDTDPTDPSWLAISGSPIPVGTLLDFAGTTVPDGYLGCDGTAVSRTTYADLFVAIGSGALWGVGDGSTTFNLPDFRRRTAVGSGGSAGGGLNATVGSTGGAETKTLGLNEMPDHTHNNPGSNFIERANADNIYDGGGLGKEATTTGLVTSHAGSTSAFNLLQPSAVVLKIIKY